VKLKSRGISIILNARELTYSSNFCDPYNQEPCGRKLLRGYAIGAGAAPFKHIPRGTPLCSECAAILAIASVQRVYGNLVRANASAAGR
jgi:hypothetical protein